MSQKDQSDYDDRLSAVESAIHALPAPQRELVQKYRRLVELGGRAGPGGCALDLLEGFIDDVRATFEQAMVPRQPPPAPVHEGTSAGFMAERVDMKREPEVFDCNAIRERGRT